MKTEFELSENGWEYTGYVTIESKSKPVISKKEEHYIVSVDGIKIYFDEEIVESESNK